ncbi:transposase family protein [Solitalea lacus]|uniref:ISAon1 family transposase N-terminal region protein n=1 Tax=Solitalea lacus TaxID=2911172 RepID=UPI001EDB6DF2|nr:transposase family protein [Solitalea lacus]UKJ05848.1 transposase family protein [Solitalea lacus]
MQGEDFSLIQLILPSGILDYFIISKVAHSEKAIHIHLKEKNEVPDEFRHERLISKGFFDEIQVQDFPIRGKAVYLLIKRRRWINESTGNTVFRNWEHVAKGTRMTKEFAAFLKVIARHQAR